MNLKRHFIFANAAAVVIPLVITAVFALAFLFITSNFKSPWFSFEDYQKFSETQIELLYIKQDILKQSPEVIKSPEFIKELQTRLSAINGEFIILQGEQVLFNSHNLSKIDVAKSLDAVNSHVGNASVKLGNMTYRIHSVKLSLTEGVSGYVLLLVPIDPSASNDVTRFLILIGIIFTLSFVLTNVFASYRFTRRTLSPLNHLKKAAGEISSGNLDYPIVEEGDQEIQELCRDLELMRLKLKDSIHTQLKFEENRKMLVSSISHDLKTPITSIKGYIEGIRDGVANTPEKHDRYLQTIYAQAQLVDQMIEDLLLYAKLDLKQLPFDFERTDIEDYLHEFVLENEPACIQNGIELSFQSSLIQHTQILLDQNRFRRVLMNILDNSKKYIQKSSIREKGKINVFLRDTRSSLIIELMDNGPGISKDDLPYIFDRFYRSDRSRGKIKGSGLGLAIARQIVEGHNGIIWAVSKNQEGTRILISLSKL